MAPFKRDRAAARTASQGAQPAEPVPGISRVGDATRDPEPSAPVVISPSGSFAPTGLAGIAGLPAVAGNGEMSFSSRDYMTPVYRLVNPVTGSRITLVANIHIGDRKSVV